VSIVHALTLLASTHFRNESEKDYTLMRVRAHNRKLLREAYVFLRVLIHCVSTNVKGKIRGVPLYADDMLKD
jgi:hypothetical protein